MNGSIFFVHGTGVWESRRKSTKPDLRGTLKGTLDTIRQHIAASSLAGVSIDGPAWGEEIGPAWPDVQLALPKQSNTKAISADGIDQDDDSLWWEFLLTDPLAELRLAGLASPAISAMIPNADLAEIAIAEVVRGTALLDGELAAAGIDRRKIPMQPNGSLKARNLPRRRAQSAR